MTHGGSFDIEMSHNYPLIYEVYSFDTFVFFLLSRSTRVFAVRSSFFFLCPVCSRLLLSHVVHFNPFFHMHTE